MSINPNGLKEAIASEMGVLDNNITPDDAQLALAKGIINYLLTNLDITIPTGSVVDAVTGGSGAPAIGIKNTIPIDLDVS